MKFNLFTLLFILIFVSSCEEKKHTLTTSEEKKSSIITSLNDDKTEDAISSATAYLEKNPNDEDVKFFLASAYAKRSGIDVYSLYPLLEVVLFHSPGKDWGDRNNRRNPLKRFLTSSSEQELKDEHRMIALNEKYYLHEMKFLNKEQSKYQYSCEEARNENEKEICLKHEEFWKSFYSANGSISYPTTVKADDWYNSVYDERFLEINNNINDYPELFSYDDNGLVRAHNIPIYNYYETLKNETQKLKVAKLKYWSQRQESEEEKEDRGEYTTDTILDKMRNEDIEKTWMNFVWNIYESVPIWKRLPVIDETKIEDLRKALSILEELSSSTNKIKYVNYQGLISILTISHVLKESIDLNKIYSFKDFLCRADIEIFLEKTEIFKMGISKFVDALFKHPEVDISHTQLDNLEVELDLIPNEVSEEHKDQAIRGFIRRQIDQCE